MAAIAGAHHSVLVLTARTATISGKNGSFTSSFGARELLERGALQERHGGEHVAIRDDFHVGRAEHVAEQARHEAPVKRQYSVSADTAARYARRRARVTSSTPPGASKRCVCRTAACTS